MHKRKKVFHFEWKTSPTQLNEKRLHKRFIRRGYYSEPQLRHLHRVNWSHAFKLKVISWLTMKLTEKAGFRTSMAYKLFPHLNHEYFKLGALGMAKKYDLPPIAICNAFERSNPHLADIDWHTVERNKATALDITSQPNIDRFKIQADAFEENLIKFFDRYGVRYKTELELKEEQIAKYGRAVATVDILFEDDVYINGKLTRWLECKNYILARNKIVEPKVRKQLKRYVDRWGQGAVVYRHGYLFDFPMDSVTTLDGGDLTQINLIKEKHFL